MDNIAPIRHLVAERERLRGELAAERRSSTKYSFVRQHIGGSGIEIGAFEQPLPVNPGVVVCYVDKFPTTELRRRYPDANPVHVNVVDDGERLATIASDSQDFVLASHMLEHCQDPIGAIKNMLRVVRVGGAILQVVPDKRFTFDVVRPVTPFAHLLADYHRGAKASQRGHCEEWVRLIDKLTDPAEIAAKTQHLLATDWPIHYHVWTAPDVLEMFTQMRQLEGFNFNIEAYQEDRQFEVTVVIRRTR